MRSKEEAKGRMYTDFIFVTPEMAADFRKRAHPNQRPLIKAAVEKYEQELLDNNFVVSTDCIAFDTDDYYVNGNHRAEAAKNVGIGFWTWVIYNFPFKENVWALDQGQGRGLGGILAMETKLGLPVGFLKPLVAAIMFPTSRAKTPTPNRVVRFANDHENAIKFVADVFGKRSWNRGKKLGLYRPAFQAVIARAWYYTDEATLRRFVDIMLERIPADPSEHATTKALSDLLINLQGRDPDKADTHGKCERALHAFINKRPIGRLRAEKIELWPIRGEAGYVFRDNHKLVLPTDDTPVYGTTNGNGTRQLAPYVHARKAK